MSVNKTNFYEAFDDYLNWIVLWFLTAAINLGMEAGAFLLSEEIGQQIHAWAQWPMRIGTLLLFVALFVFIRRRWRSGWSRGDRIFMDGFTVNAVKRAGFAAFCVTVPTVVFLDIVTNDTTLPADFFIKLPGFTLTATFSLAYFYLNRDTREESDDKEAVA